VEQVNASLIPSPPHFHIPFRILASVSESLAAKDDDFGVQKHAPEEEFKLFCR